MAKIRIVHVSDTHLSPTHTYFAMNWTAFQEDMRAAPPDLLVHGGDLAFNAPALEADLAYAGQELKNLGVPWRAIPGNHDIGEAPSFSRLKQPLTPQQIAAWHRHVGPQWWSHDIGEWRLIGLDTSLMGSALVAEAEQRAFFTEALATRGKRPVMVFIHMPPYDQDPNDTAWTVATIAHAPRVDFLETCATSGVKIICCGHLHTYRRLRHRGMHIVWAPPTAMVDVARGLRNRKRFPRPGYVEWTLDGRKASHKLIEPERMFVIDMARWTANNNATVTTLPPWPALA